MPRGARDHVWPGLAVLGIVLASALIRLRLVAMPLDRDEGEYAYMGQLLLRGVPPYVEAYNMKMPGIYAVYAAILAVFGQTPSGIRAGLIVANAGVIALVFLLGRQLVSPTVGVAGALAFAGLAISPAVLGLAAYAEHFVLLPALGGVLLLFRATEARSRWCLGLAGTLFGLAFLIKQSGGLFGAFGVAWLLVSRRPAPARRGRDALTDVAVLAAGALAPIGLLGVVLALTGSLPNFWFWTFQYAAQYVSAVPLRIGLRELAAAVDEITRSSPLLVAAALAGGLVLARDPALRERRLGFGLLGVCSFLAVTPGLYFRRQYFILLLPVLALLAALLADALVRRVGGVRPRAAVAAAGAVMVLAALLGVWKERRILLQATPVEAAREIYGRNPFPESVVIADYLRRHSTSADTIAVIGSEPQIYFYTGRRAATGFIYMYPLMERHPYAARMQHAMIREIEVARPRFLVWVGVSTSWLKRPDSDPTLGQWFEGYRQRFERVGVADILSPAVTRYVWDDDAVSYTPQSSRWVAVLRRRADLP